MIRSLIPKDRHNYKYKTFFSFLLIFIYKVAFTQKADDSFFTNSSIGVSGYYGSFLTTQPKSEYIRDSYSYFGEIYFEKQTTGSSDWQSSHNYPSWGVSYIHGNTGSKEYIGNMDAVYAFLNIPIIRTKKFTNNFRLGAGPGWVQNPYDIDTNPKNTIIGTKLNAYISLMFRNEIKILPKIYGNISLGLTHLSNGGTSLPNLGLNTPVVSAGVRYAFHEPIVQTKMAIDSFRKRVSYRVSISSALKQIQLVGGPYNLLFVVQPEIVNHFSPNHSYGYGITFFLNPYAEMDKKKYNLESESTNTLQAGIFGAYEHYFGRLSIPLQVGAYVYNQGKSPLLFQQIGMKYQLNNKLNTELHVKTHLGKADFIHAGIGYTL